ncbi:hypothetical protein SVIOM342S_01764 [Streptomyces violaceorubidus]
MAERLAAFGAPAAPEASLLAGRIALGLGWMADAERHLAVAARSRHGGPPLARMTGWAAQALRARAAGSARGVLEACRRGLDVLDDHRMTLGASELRARATAQGAELAALAQRASLVSGGPRRLLGWSERWRATVLSAPPTRPPADPVLLTAMTAFRELAARAEEARTDGGRPAPALEREQRRLEREIRCRTLHMRGEAPGDGDRFDVARLLRRLGDEVRLVELAVLDGRVHVLLCGQGRVRRFEAGLLAEAEVEAEHVQAGLRRLAHPGAEARLPLVEAAGARLQHLLLGPAAAHLGSGPVVVVPPGRLHRVPWALLPALRERVLSVSPSASSWLRARDTAPPPGGRQVLVRGPGLASGGAEVPELSDRYTGRRTPAGTGTGTPPGAPPSTREVPSQGGRGTSRRGPVTYRRTTDRAPASRTDPAGAWAVPAPGGRVHGEADRNARWSAARRAGAWGVGPVRPLVRVRHRHSAGPPAHGGQQFAQQPQVPPAQAVQPVDGERLQGGVRAGREQFGGLLAGQRFQGEARQQLTGPQPGHRARYGGAVGGDDQEAGAAVHGELVHEGGGGVVEQVCVVDQQQPYAGQELDRAVQGDPLGQQVGEGGEGDVPGLGRPGGADRVGAAHGLGHEPGLARARRARHHEPAPAGRHGPAHQLQFVRPAGERPGGLQPLRVPQRSRHGNMSRHTHP